jgi:hypothetical protein
MGSVGHEFFPFQFPSWLLKGRGEKGEGRRPMRIYKAIMSVINKKPETAFVKGGLFFAI